MGDNIDEPDYEKMRSIRHALLDTLNTMDDATCDEPPQLDDIINSDDKESKYIIKIKHIEHVTINIHK